MRAIDLAMLIIIIEMGIGFLSSPDLGLFTPSVLGAVNPDAASNVYVAQYQSNDSFKSLTNQPSNVNMVTLALDWAFAGWSMFLSILTAFAFISWTLYSTFHLPMQICLFVQGIVYFIYSLGILEWKSGKGMSYFD
jgi:hypothetical protein